MAQRVTLKEVAERAGVSYQTVSKVLNKQVQVTKETEQRILEAVQQLGYRPNLIARNMRQQRSRLIGYSWEPAPPDQANPILDRFLQSMALEAEQAGYHLLCFTHRSGKDLLAGHRELIETNRVDGFVISSVEFDDPRIAFFQEQGFPFVAFGRSNPEWVFPYVDVDGAVGMQQVVEHLFALGHRRIAALAWPLGSRVGQNRLDGFLKAFRAAGLEVPEGYICRGEGTLEFGQAAAAGWLDLPPAERPTALVALNDMMALGAMRAVQGRGLVVGQDIAITGFDDMPMSQYLNPALTSVRQPVWEVGQQIMSTLLAILNDEAPQDSGLLLAPQLIVRPSSGGPIA